MESNNDSDLYVGDTPIIKVGLETAAQSYRPDIVRIKLLYQPHQFVRYDDHLRHAPVEILLRLTHHHNLLLGDAIFVKPLKQLVFPVIARGAGRNDEQRPFCLVRSSAGNSLSRGPDDKKLMASLFKLTQRLFLGKYGQRQKKRRHNIPREGVGTQTSKTQSERASMLQQYNYNEWDSACGRVSTGDGKLGTWMVFPNPISSAIIARPSFLRTNSTPCF